MNQVKLGEAEALFAVLRQSADADVVAAIEALVRDAPDSVLNRVNVLDFAAKRGLDQERVIAAFLHAARVGLFDLSWNVLVPAAAARSTPILRSRPCTTTRTPAHCAGLGTSPRSTRWSKYR